jgi:pimeloyl-ACP methyl ester carboxylesterase
MNDRVAPPAPERFAFRLADGALHGLRWKNNAKPPLLFCHATGFCASAYKRMLGLLSDRYDVFALDMRGHGRTDLAADPSRLRSWRIYADDVRAFLDNERRAGWTLAGHSFGAAASLMAACGRSDVAALKLIEPVAMPPWFAAAAKSPLWPLLAARIPLVRQAARRRSQWDSRETVAASYARKALFRNWAPGVLADYLEDGLEERDGGVALSCDPRWEAATFAAQANDFWAAARNAPAPIKVYAANHPSSTVSLDARRRFTRIGAQLLVEKGPSHLAPMERPAEMAAFITA